MSTTHHSKLRPVGGDTKSALARALARFRGAFIGVGAFSALINLLTLTGSIFMLQVYDRVLPSKSVPTLVGLALIVTGLYAFQAVLDLIRTRVLVRVGSAFDASLTERVHDAIVKLTLKAPRGPEGLQPIRDLDVIRSFLTSSGPIALFDLPWIPLYLGLCFAFHFYIGLTATIGALIIVGLTLLTEALSRVPIRDAARHSAVRQHPCGNEPEKQRGASRPWYDEEDGANAGGRPTPNIAGQQQRVSDVTAGLGSVARVLRLLLQSTVLGVGAYLVIEQQATAGIIIASSIITARALAPADIAHRQLEGLRLRAPRLAASERPAQLPPGRR